MADLTRFGISMERWLLQNFDEYIRDAGYDNRSQAIAELMRSAVAENRWDQGGAIAGALSVIYNHHNRDLLSNYMEIQHRYFDIILSNQHIHLDHDNCLEIIALRGSAQRVRQLIGELRGMRGLEQISHNIMPLRQHSGGQAHRHD